MKIYLISQGQNTGYDTYDSAVVIAENEEAARRIHPNWDDIIDRYWNEDTEIWCYKANGKPGWSSSRYGTSDWTAPQHVDVEYLGEAKEGSVESIVCASFNAG